jgi:PIN domain nuclease of toxin-antitoxin system
MTVAYLDTHALVWLYVGVVERFAAASQRVIETHDLLVSPMALVSKDRLIAQYYPHTVW